MFLAVDNPFEIYIGLVAVVFTAAGLWLATVLGKQKNAGEVEVRELALTSREYEVLRLIAQGLSNAEIAEKMFLSLSTVKTYVSRLFVKMDVKNRAQALEKANRLKISTSDKVIL